MWPLFKIVNLIYLLVSGYAWFGFLLPSNIIPIVVSMFMVICFGLGNFQTNFTSRVYALFGAIIVYFLVGTYILGAPYGLLMFFSYLPAILIFMLNIPQQQDLLGYVTKWVGIILGLSIVGFALSFFVSLPHGFFVPQGMEDRYSLCENYYLFIKRTAFTEGGLNVVRFSGPFIEPGHLSMVCGVILFANKFRMKQSPILWVYIVSLLISLSLAGYVILLVGLIMCRMRNVYSIVALLSIGVGAWAFVAFGWQNGDNPVNKMIFERLAFDESKGIAGNNRTIVQTDFYFSQCVKDGRIWLGVRSQKEEKLKIRGAGYKIFMLRYGVVSVLLVAWIYLLLIPPMANKRYAISFFVLIVLMFLQRAYPWSYPWLFSYVLGIGLSRGKSFKELILGTDDSDTESIDIQSESLTPTDEEDEMEEVVGNPNSAIR